ncbi:nuclear transport factor 2 family protein [Poriferisphaera corsica]|nr:ketosteroid isomerase [Poriferisphaera corsica]
MATKMTLTEDLIKQMFKHIENADFDAFFENVHDDVEWTIMGSHAFAGTYKGKKVFRSGAYVPVNKDVKDGAMLHVERVYLDENVAVVEMVSLPTDFKHKTMSNTYCWVMEFDDDLKVFKVRAYVDPALMHKMMVESCS